MSVGTGYSESYTYDSSKRIQSVTRTIEGRSYTTSYQYNTANQITQMIYPVSGRTLNLAHDSVGRVSSMADQYRTYINNFGYNGAGQTTGFSLGNVASENYDYDTNRMQLITQRATQTGGAANGLMNLTYAYNASGGQMGSGSTAGNAGQLISISGTIGGVTESAAYTYDNLGRLVSSNQTSNGSSAQRRFAYDRWGNRTGVWDATSGGNQIQSITLQQSGGVPTNRIATVTSGSTVNYTYDAAGSVTNDGVHSYGYDSENRLVSVDGGSTASYAYDNQNRRYKKTVGSTVTHYVWQGSQVMGEYDGTTGGVLYNYVYSGSRLLAKIGFGVVNWFVSDRLSTRLMLDGSGNVIGRQGHLPFGEDFGESGTQEKHHFTSYERDGESGTDYAINRQHSPNLGRFMTADQYKASGGVRDPQSWSRYRYSRNDPVNKADPLGLLEGPPPGPCLGLTPGECLCRYVAPEFCQPSGKPPKDRDDPVGGGDKKKPKIKYSDYGDKAGLFFGFHLDCIKAFQAMGIYEKFLKKAHDAKYIDLRDDANKDLKDWSPAALGLDPSRTKTLDEEDLFLENGALGLTVAKAIFIGHGVHTEEELQETVVHEGLHNYFHEPNHVKLLTKMNQLDPSLKLPIPEGPGADVIANLILNNWLNGGCKK